MAQLDEFISSSDSEHSSEYNSGDSNHVETTIASKLLSQLHDIDEPASVSEDEISRNKQEQHDEIVALEAIYEGAFTTINDTCFMIKVPMQLAAETIEVVLEQASPSSSSISFHSFTLEFLSPIRFGFSFPRTYPSRSPPVFVLESQWIPADKLVLLSDQLSHIWAEQSGEVVVYPWSEFLHSQALSFLGISEQLVLEASPYPQLDHPNIISGVTFQQTTAASLLEYNEDMVEKTFNTSLRMCEICFTEHLGKEFVRLPCEHMFCEVCMKTHSSMHVAERTLTRLRCPSCPEAIPPFILKRLLSEPEFERWERMLLENTLASMSDVVYCPRCETPCIEESADHHTLCEKCFFSFCGLCKNYRHSGECFSAAQQLAGLEVQAAKVNALKDAAMRAEERITRQEERLKKQIEELKSVEAIRVESKFCPSCNMAIMRVGGCNKVTCTVCGNSFCYKCGEKVSGYGHFKEDGCRMFTIPSARELVAIHQQDQIHELKMRMRGLRRPDALRYISERDRAMKERANKRVENEEDVAAFPERARTCPACRKKNAKVQDNNHVLCHSCHIHYCGLCLKPVKRASDHFGVGKCKQHTEDVRS